MAEKEDWPPLLTPGEHVLCLEEGAAIDWQRERTTRDSVLLQAPEFAILSETIEKTSSIIETTESKAGRNTKIISDAVKEIGKAPIVAIYEWAKNNAANNAAQQS